MILSTDSLMLARIHIVIVLIMVMAGCSSVEQNEQTSTKEIEKGRIINGLKEGVWFTYKNGVLEKVDYYYQGNRKFELATTDFNFSNYCPDSSRFCWQYPEDWSFEHQPNDLLSWIDKSSEKVPDVSRPVVNCAFLVVPSETAENIGNFLVANGVTAIESEADSISILEDRLVSTLTNGVFAHKFICKVYKDGVCYGLCRVIVSSDGEALVLTGTASCDNDIFVKKLSVFIEMASSITYLGNSVFDYDRIWKE